MRSKNGGRAEIGYFHILRAIRFRHVILVINDSKELVFYNYLVKQANVRFAKFVGNEQGRHLQ